MPTPLDRARLQELVARHRTDLRAYVESLMGEGLLSKEAPSDIAQSTLREVLQDLEKGVPLEFQGDRQFQSFLRQRVRWKIGKRLRSPENGKGPGVEFDEVHHGPDGSPSDDGMLEGEELARLESALAALPPKDQDMLRLVKLEGWTVSDVARMQGKPRSTVQSQLGAAMAQLAARMLSPGQPSPRSGPDR